MEDKELRDLQDKDYFIAIVDGSKCKDLSTTIASIANAFLFPDYYGENLNAFDECINDLEWLNKSNYALVIENSEAFMANDTSDNKSYLVKFLGEISKEWADVPNYKNEDTFRRKADFKVLYN
jgi:hypothetical protein